MDYSELPGLITPEQAAEVLQVAPSTVTRMCRAGKLKAVKVMTLWRINRDALLEFAGLAPADGREEPCGD